MTDLPEPPETNQQPDVHIQQADEQVIAHRSTRARRGRGKGGIRVDLTSMIDVTFLLLIYFMIATEFKLGEEVYHLDLPQQLQSNQQRDPFELDEEPLRIEVTSVGIAGLQYRLSIDGIREQPKTFDELESILASRQLGVSGGLYATDHPIIIKPARSATWEHTVATFNAIARAKYTSIKFAKAE